MFQEIIDIIVRIREDIKYKSQLRKGMKSLNKNMVELTRSTRGFRAEWLSVMFFGMAISRVFGEVTQASMDLWGTTDLLSASMQIAAVEGFNPIQAATESLALAFLDLPPSMQGIIGTFAGFMDLGGRLLTTLGVVILGVAGLAKAFGITSLTGMAIPELLTTIGGAIASAIPPILAIIAVLTILYLSWENNWFNMRDVVKKIVDGIGSIIDGLITTIKGFFNIFVGIVTLDGAKIREGFDQIFGGIKKIVIDGLGSILTGILTFIASVILSFFNWGKRLGEIVWDTFASLPRIISDSITGFLNAMYNFGRDIVNFIVNGIKSIGSTIWNTLMSYIPEPIKEMGGAAAETFHSITGLQKGGIITKPTIARIGEAGPEAIIPLKKGYSGSSTTTISYNPVYYISVSDRAEWEEALRDRDAKMIDEIKRMVI